MTNDMDESLDDISVAEHEGDVRIYVSADTDTYLQSDMTVSEYLDTVDADEDYSPDGDSNDDT